jgi:hypothetical protein
MYDMKMITLIVSKNGYSECRNLTYMLMIHIIIINRMIAEELTEYLIASQIDVQVRQVLDRFWSSLM